MRDIPLDEFADEAAKDTTSGDDETAMSDEPDKQSTQEDNETTPEPPTSTATWTPAGGTCTACGTVVDRRWTDDGALVCSSCKSW